MPMYNPESTNPERAYFAKAVGEELLAYARTHDHDVDMDMVINWTLGARAAWDVFHARYNVTPKEEVNAR